MLLFDVQVKKNKADLFDQTSIHLWGQTFMKLLFLSIALINKKRLAWHPVYRTCGLVRQLMLATIVMFFSGLPMWVNAQNPLADFSFAHRFFERVGNEDSLPINVVTAITQDKRGLIWVGTQAGLVSYDGYRFEKYTHFDNDQTSISGN